MPTPLHTKTFTHGNFDREICTYREPFTQSNFHIKELLHTDALTHREGFTHRNVHTHMFLHREPKRLHLNFQFTILLQLLTCDLHCVPQGCV